MGTEDMEADVRRSFEEDGSGSTVWSGKKGMREIKTVIVELDHPKYDELDECDDEYYGTGTELIRCRNCKHRMHDGTCIKVMKRKPDEGYCDEGERNV